MTDDQELVAEARKTQGYSEGDLRSIVRSLADALSAAAERATTAAALYREQVETTQKIATRARTDEVEAWSQGYESGLSAAAVRYRAEALADAARLAEQKARALSDAATSIDDDYSQFLFELAVDIRTLDDHRDGGA